MGNPTDEDRLDNATSLTREEAVLRLLGMPPHYLDQVWLAHDDNPEGGEYVGETLYDIVQGEYESAEDAYNTAKREKLSIEVVAEKLAELDRCVLQNANFQRYNCDIVDELAKQDKSELRIDKFATTNLADPHITISSLDLWVLKKYRVKTEVKEVPPPECQEQDKPWLKVDLRDPAPEQPWYVPARYFARQLVKHDSTLLIRKDQLAKKVVQSLTGVGIYKRGNLLPHNAATVKKSFSKVKLS
ncbi:MAG TPA: hypothetical protein PL131_13985 [Methylotenera sp.]|nr:hypothetical protein [Methylotenera sp.]HPV33034.1 hypothetical protein [Methylotenera sp.]